MRKQEDILIPNKPFVEEITDAFRLGRYYSYLAQEYSLSFKDLYMRFGHASFYENYNKELRFTYREWNKIRPLAFAVALLGTMIFPHGPSLSINTRVIMLAYNLLNGFKNQGQVKYLTLSSLYQMKGCYKYVN